MEIKPVASNAIEITTEQGITYELNDARDLGLGILRKDKQNIKVSCVEGMDDVKLGTHYWIYFDRKGYAGVSNGSK